MESSKKHKNDQVNILLVDDLYDNLLALEGLLRQDDVDIFKAKSGTEALEFIVAHEFALALIDVQMPGINGFELAELMRGAKKSKNIPIIFVTATARDQAFAFKGYQSGAVDFLQKPLDTFAVKSKVNIFIEFYRQKREQEKLLTKLKKTQVELEQAIKIRDEFMSIASHELKTPLTTLNLNAQMRKRNLRKNDLSLFNFDRLIAMFNEDEKQIGRINHLIDDMLDISRINSGMLSLNLECFDLCELVRELVERSSEQFKLVGCPITVELCQPTRGTWDRFRIEQVLTNLLTNAMRYGSGKPIIVQVTSDSDKARIVVRDQGRGIAKENHERIFKRFERAISGNEISGLGLGLYIVTQILEAHKASIQVESEVGQGATFTVELPLLEQVKEVPHDI